MSVKEAWNDDWKRRCRSKIKACDVVIVHKIGIANSGQLDEK